MSSDSTAGNREAVDTAFESGDRGIVSPPPLPPAAVDEDSETAEGWIVPPPLPPVPLLPAPLEGISPYLRSQWVGGLSLAALLLAAGDSSLEQLVITLPFVSLAAWGRAADRLAASRVMSVLWVLSLVSLAAGAYGFLAHQVRVERAQSAPMPAGVPPPHGLPTDLSITLLGGAALAIAIVMLHPVSRRLAARLTPIDPSRFSHRLALAASVSISFLLFGQLALSGGRPLMIELVRLGNESIRAAASNTSAQELLQGTFLVVPALLVAAGWGSFRGFRQTLVRLGVVMPTLKQLIGGLAAAAILVIVVLSSEELLASLLGSLNVPGTDEKTFDSMMQSLKNPLGAFAVGVSAGIQEELAIRGLLQPRVGILASNLFFTSLHAPQYGLDGLIVVFIVGATLGVVRARTNTSTSILVHAVYNFILVLGSATE